MPFPKLSAVLNNCALHAITPELKNEIINFQSIEHYDNGHNEDYELLKNKFALFYGFFPETFTWDKFAELLKKYNEFDTQIIMGPVLREFMKEKMIQDEFVTILAQSEEKSNDQYISEKIEINPNTSRYESLGPDEVFAFVGKYLGLNIQYFKNMKGEITNAPHSVATIQMHHQGGIEGAQAGGHWERSNNDQEITDYQNLASTQLTPFLPLLGNDNKINPYGFELLKKYVQTTARLAEEHDKFELLKLATSAEQIDFYIRALNVLPKELAVSLLGNHLTEETQSFIEESDYSPILLERNPIYEQWFRAPSDNKPALQEGMEEVIQAFLIPPKFPETPQANEHHLGEKEFKIEDLTEEEQQVLEATVSDQKEKLTPELFANYKKEITTLIQNKNIIFKNAEKNASKEESELTDQELAERLQAEEFIKAGIKP